MALERGTSASPIKANVGLVRELEHAAQRRRSRTERLSDRITTVIGSVTFVGIHLLIFAVWCFVNTGIIPGLKPFDPFPFGILTLFVSAEGVLLAIFVLISQNRMMRDADRRAHLDLQINLLAEQTSTKTLELLRHLSERLGLPEMTEDEEATRLVERTDVAELAEELERQLPKD